VVEDAARMEGTSDLLKILSRNSLSEGKPLGKPNLVRWLALKWV